MTVRQFIGVLEAPALSLTIGEAAKHLCMSMNPHYFQIKAIFLFSRFINLFLNLQSDKKLKTMIVFFLILAIQKNLIFEQCALCNLLNLT